MVNIIWLTYKRLNSGVFKEYVKFFQEVVEV